MQTVTAVTSSPSSSNNSSPYTPMSERQQMALIKQMTEQTSTPDKTGAAGRIHVLLLEYYHNLCTKMLPAPPPPLHSVATPSCPGLRLRTRWLVILAPDIPNG